MILPDVFTRYIQSFIPINEYKAFIESCSRPLRKCIRLNPKRMTLDELFLYAQKHQWTLSPIPWNVHGFFIDREDTSIPLGKTELHRSGCIYIQEASSMIPPSLINHQDGDIILDFAAAPGSKTTQIAEANNQILILANEPDKKRIKALRSNVDRMGHYNVVISNKDGKALTPYFTNFFDTIILDAPCSGEGTIRKDHKALETWSEKRIEKMAQDQKILAEQAFRMLKPGGRMIYSTCTLNPLENEYVIQHILELFPRNANIIPLSPSWHTYTNPLLEGTIKIWPHHYDTEGFFIAMIGKEHTNENSSFLLGSKRSSPYTLLPQHKKNQFNTYLINTFAISMQKEHLEIRNNEIILKHEKTEKIAQRVTLDTHGIVIGIIHASHIELTHEGALYIYYTYKPQQSVRELQTHEYNDYIQGKDLPYEEFSIVTYKKQALGCIKAHNGRGKNILPRHLVYT